MLNIYISVTWYSLTIKKPKRGLSDCLKVMLEQTRNASAEKMPPASQLATLLDDLLASNLQGSLTEMTQYLEMKFINENNPDVQAARMKDVSSLDSGMCRHRT